MDRVRLGRALGTGTRQAAKNLMEIADAALSPDPSGEARQASAASVQHTQERTASPMRPTVAGVAEGGRRFTETFFAKLARLGGALWLEFTGVFFGVFALFGAEGVWKMRAALHAGASQEQRQRLLLAIAVTLAFGYFCVSSFVRARRRERGQHKRR